MTSPAPSDRLRELARRVERLPSGHRLSPADPVEAREALAGELRRLAADLERAAGRRRPEWRP